MGVLNTSYTFTATDVVTSEKMNNIIDQSVFTDDALVAGNTSLQVVGGKLQVICYDESGMFFTSNCNFELSNDSYESLEDLNIVIPTMYLKELFSHCGKNDEILGYILKEESNILYIYTTNPSTNKNILSHALYGTCDIKDNPKFETDKTFNDMGCCVKSIELQRMLKNVKPCYKVDLEVYESALKFSVDNAISITHYIYGMISDEDESLAEHEIDTMQLINAFKSYKYADELNLMVNGNTILITSCTELLETSLYVKLYSE